MWKNLSDRIKDRFKSQPSFRDWLKVEPTAIISLGKGYNISGKINVGKGSKLEIEDNVKITSNFVIGQNCKVTIGRQTQISNTTFSIHDGSSVNIGEGVIFDSPHPVTVRVSNGVLAIDEKVHIQSEILVRFGGRLLIGKYTGIGYNSEIRCEDHIEIGSYGLFSYNLRIFDTNTHSINWEERRRVIENGYPVGAHEIAKPDTAPIKIGNDVWIGEGATILKGVSIGDRCIIGTRAIIGSGKYASDSVIVSGKPRIIRKKYA